jgi:hypothetical protein
MQPETGTDSIIPESIEKSKWKIQKNYTFFGDPRGERKVLRNDTDYYIITPIIPRKIRGPNNGRRQTHIGWENDCLTASRDPPGRRKEVGKHG